MIILGVMESNSATVDRAETANNKMEEEMDESLLDETEEESVAKAPSANARDSSNSNNKKVANVKAQKVPWQLAF